MKALRNVAPVARMVWEAAPGLVVWGLACRLVAALLPLGLLAVTKLIIDAIHGYTAGQSALPGHFWWLVALEFGLAAATATLTRLTDFCDTLLADRYTRHVSLRMMEHATRLDLACYEDPLFYDKMERARAQGTDRVLMIPMAGRLIQQAVTTASLAAGILLFSPWLLLVLFACVIPAFVGESHFAFLGYSLNFQQTTARRELDYLRWLGGSREGAKEVKLFGLGPHLVERYRSVSDELHRQVAALAKSRLAAGALLTLLGTAGYYGSYAWVIYQTVTGALTLGTLTFLAGAIAGTSANIQAVFSTFAGMADQALFVNDLLDFFAVRPRTVSKPGARPAPRPIREGFEFRNVSFRYPNNGRQVLDGVSFRLEPAARVALVGANGQGKTTIVKLLMRLYDVSEGQILLDGVDLREYDLEDLWKQVGVIFQDFMRYEMTAADNVAVGRIEARGCRELLRAAAARSGAAEVIGRLPRGYEQVLGCRFEGGVDLSCGEWQRVALARGYLRDAQVLILDEPTAALDARSEHEVFRRFLDLTECKTSLLISHRFSTVRMADHILVLDNGRITEQGSHGELMRKARRYAEMFELQASSYR